MPHDLARRVALARQHAGFPTPQALAERVSDVTGQPMTAAQVRAIETGAARVSGRLVHIAIVCRVRPEWLLLNDGPMVEGGETAPPAPDGAALSPAERHALGRFRLLPPHLQTHVIEILNALALPMDPAYRAWEVAQEANNRLRNPSR